MQGLQGVLEEGIARLGLAPAPQAQARLLAYVGLLAKWNRVYNLTSVRKPRDMIQRHILDSLVVLPHVGGERLLDVGSGAGLPGIPLALWRPELDVTLLDSSGKKARFLRQAVAELGLDNARVVHSRIEDYRATRPFDTVIARAYSTLADYHAETASLCTPHGRLLAMKGVYPVAEVEALPDRDIVSEVVPLDVPGLDAQRHLVVLKPQTPEHDHG